eukprot:PhM_4_TR9980/c0_g1_i1/m.12028
MSSALSSLLSKIKPGSGAAATTTASVVAHSTPATATAPATVVASSAAPTPNVTEAAAAHQPAVSSLSIGVEVVLFRGSTSDSLGINVDGNLVVTSVVPNSPAARCGVPLRHRIVMCDGVLVSDLASFQSVMSRATHEVTFRMVPMKLRNELDAQALEEVLVCLVRGDDVDLDALRADPRHEFLNEGSTHYEHYCARRADALKAKEALEALAQKVAETIQGRLDGAAGTEVTDEMYDAALMFVDTFFSSTAAKLNEAPTNGAPATGDGANVTRGPAQPEWMETPGMWVTDLVAAHRKRQHDEFMRQQEMMAQQQLQYAQYHQQGMDAFGQYGAVPPHVMIPVPGEGLNQDITAMAGGAVPALGALQPSADALPLGRAASSGSSSAGSSSSESDATEMEDDSTEDEEGGESKKRAKRTKI